MLDLTMDDDDDDSVNSTPDGTHPFDPPSFPPSRWRSRIPDKKTARASAVQRFHKAPEIMITLSKDSKDNIFCWSHRDPGKDPSRAHSDTLPGAPPPSSSTHTQHAGIKRKRDGDTSESDHDIDDDEDEDEYDDDNDLYIGNFYADILSRNPTYTLQETLELRAIEHAFVHVYEPSPHFHHGQYQSDLQREPFHWSSDNTSVMTRISRRIRYGERWTWREAHQDERHRHRFRRTRLSDSPRTCRPTAFMLSSATAASPRAKGMHALIHLLLDAEYHSVEADPSHIAPFTEHGIVHALVDTGASICIVSPKFAVHGAPTSTADTKVETCGSVQTFGPEVSFAMTFQDGTVRLLPAVIGTTIQLPRNCDVLLGLNAIRALHIDTQYHVDHKLSIPILRMLDGDRQFTAFSQAQLNDAKTRHQNMPPVPESSMMPEAYMNERLVGDFNERNPASGPSDPHDHSDVDINSEWPAWAIRRARALLHKYRSVFSESPDELPPAFNRDDPHKVELKPDAKFSYCPQPRFGPHTTVYLNRLAEQWKRTGFAVKAPENCRYASRIHIVKKAGKLGKHDPLFKLRPTLDLVRINAMCKKMATSAPNTTTEVERHGPHTYFVQSDAHSAYWQILVDAASQPLFSFWTPTELLMCTRMPFGALNAGSVMQRHTTTIRREMRRVAIGHRNAGAFSDAHMHVDTPSDSYKPRPSETRPSAADAKSAAARILNTSDHMSVYMDDVLGGGADIPATLSVLEELLRACSILHITLTPTKTRVGYTQVTFLGHDVANGMHGVSKHNLAPLYNLSPPSDQSAVRRVLGIFVQSKNQIKNYSLVSRPLTKLTGKISFRWGVEEEKAFHTLRLAVSRRFKFLSLTTITVLSSKPTPVISAWAESSISGYHRTCRHAESSCT
jgi:hypothetical protein